MQRLFLFLYQYRAFLTFLFLELLCVWLIVQNNTYQGAKFFNSSNSVAAGLLQSSDNVYDYFDLTRVNKELASENADLKQKLESLNQVKDHFEEKTLKDTVINKKFEYFSAKVINNSVRNFNNYITINKGIADGVEPDMAVIGNDGVVGKVKTASRHFAVITSILHSNVQVSAKIKKTGDLCTVEWPGKDPYRADIHFVPRHVNVQVGDSVVTSGYNAVFPENIPVGIIDEVQISEDALFYDIKISLTSDINEIGYVYLIKNHLKMEQDSIETEVQQY